MKESNVLSVLVYLFKHYMQDDGQIIKSEEHLFENLIEAGFCRSTIMAAFGWLASLAFNQTTSSDSAQPTSLRLYTQEEMHMLSRECRGFLLCLEQQKILTPLSREIVIHQIMQLSQEPIDLPLLKWVILIVLFHLHKNDKDTLTHLQFFVIDEEIGGIH